MPRIRLSRFLAPFSFIFCPLLFGHLNAQTFKKTANGVVVYLNNPGASGTKAIRLTVVSDKIIRVTATPEAAFSEGQSLMALPQKTTASWTLLPKEKEVILQSGTLNAAVSLTIIVTIVLCTQAILFCSVFLSLICNIYSMSVVRFLLI